MLTYCQFLQDILDEKLNIYSKKPHLNYKYTCK